MIDRKLRWLLVAGIVTAASGCDNVSWGGMSLRLEGPPGDTLSPTSGALGSGSELGPRRIEYGPLLYAGFRRGDSASVVPVGEFVEGALRPLPQGEAAELLAAQILEERLHPGQELTLFHQGTRVGTLRISSSSGTPNDYCPHRAEALGHLELIPSAFSAERFLALEEPMGRAWPFGSFEAPAPSRAHQNAVQNLAGEALNQFRAQWPPTLEAIRQDFQVLRLSPGADAAVVATFLFQDRMRIEPAPDAAYSLLVLGEPLGTRYARTFTWYRPVGVEGKGAPLLFSWLDWDRDGEDEILLAVFGAQARWWATLEKQDGRWAIGFQDPCAATESEASGPLEGSF